MCVEFSKYNVYRRFYQIVGSFVVILCLSACTPLLQETGVPESEISAGSVVIAMDADALVLNNQSTASILFQAFPQEVLATIRWAPCDDPQSCPEQVIQPQEKKRIELSEIVQEGTTDITVYWWTITDGENEDGLHISELHTRELPLE